MSIGKYIPQFIKKPIIKLINLPEKIKWKIYNLASKGKIPVPDKLFQKWDYKIHCGRKLSFKNPQTFTEKLQWMKYYYRNPEYTKLVDKYEVRKYVAEKIGEEYLVPIYGVFNSFDEIDFDKLPEKFVIKCTHDSGSVVICTDKSKFDIVAAKKKINSGLAVNHFYKSREWPYKNVKPRIIVEKYLEDSSGKDMPDYKLFCFNGIVKLILVNSERYSESGCKTNFYWPDLTRIDMKELDYDNNPLDDIFPEDFDKMLLLSSKLSKDIPHVRTDFYYFNNHIYFGEMTFYHCGGRKPFIPDEYNKIIGDYLSLPKPMRKK